MGPVRVLIVRVAGTNCDQEAAHAWRLAGAQANLMHLHQLAAAPACLDEYQILTLPGGFSYGDDIAAGKIFAAQIRRLLLDDLRRFIDRGKLVLGICNGFQVLVKCGLLPDPKADDGASLCTVTYNEPPGFQDRWVTLRADQSPCVFTEPGRCYEMPIAHGEGRVVFRDAKTAECALRNGQYALRYAAAPPGVGQDGLPPNPNGSTADIAGLCDETGRVLGLMPHPERFVDWTQHPCWTSLPARPQGDGLAMFQRAVGCFR
ncbi:MAG: phosphoribosylformylglycinamidine synthase I [Planctomycetes bacterium]|nr:phosphoribosylformylglycinamidine synthase I [Planctomycetota bacterium]